MLHHCRHKKTLRFKGRARDFLAAYTTNRAEAARSAFVDVHGRIVAMADQALLSPDEALVVIEAAFEERLRSHLKPYLFLFGTTIEDAGFEAYYDMGGSHRLAGGEIAIPQEAGQLLLSAAPLEAKAGEEAFRLFRVRRGLPLQGVDFDDDVLLNVADDDRVSYEKGCYLGQEIIARIHFRAKPARRLVVRSEDELLPEEKRRLTSRVWEPENGRFVGFISIKNS